MRLLRDKQGMEFEAMAKILLWLALLLTLVIVIAALSGHFSTFAEKLKFWNFLE